jgi:hypothetical protein
MTVKHRRFLVLAAVLVALNTFFWLAGGGMALPKALVNQFFGNRLVRAEVIITAPGGAQDWRIDRGVISSIGGGNITLGEADGTSVTVQVDPNARVQGPARFSSVGRLRPRLHVVLYHQANQPAQLVQVEGLGS